MSSEPDTKARILDAALICAQTRPDFSMAEVAAGAGLSRQAVYLYFPDRAALLAALWQKVEAAPQTEAIAQAPSARAALNMMLARLVQEYPKAWPVALSLGGFPPGDARLADCHALAERFKEEGALSRHLSPAAAADLLVTLTSPAVWQELAVGRGWDTARYRSHVAYLAVSALTK